MKMPSGAKEIHVEVVRKVVIGMHKKNVITADESINIHLACRRRRGK